MHKILLSCMKLLDYDINNIFKEIISLSKFGVSIFYLPNNILNEDLIIQQIKEKLPNVFLIVDSNNHINYDLHTKNINGLSLDFSLDNIKEISKKYHKLINGIKYCINICLTNKNTYQQKINLIKEVSYLDAYIYNVKILDSMENKEIIEYTMLTKEICKGSIVSVDSKIFNDTTKINKYGIDALNISNYNDIIKILEGNNLKVTHLLIDRHCDL